MHLLRLSAGRTAANIVGRVHGKLSDYVVKPLVTRALGYPVQQLKRVGQSNHRRPWPGLRKQSIIVSTAASQPLSAHAEGDSRNADKRVGEILSGDRLAASRLSDSKCACRQLGWIRNADQSHRATGAIDLRVKDAAAGAQRLGEDTIGEDLVVLG
jgi:hypothetical protein